MKYWFPIPQKERDINANLPRIRDGNSQVVKEIN